MIGSRLGGRELGDEVAERLERAGYCGGESSPLGPEAKADHGKSRRTEDRIGRRRSDGGCPLMAPEGRLVRRLQVHDSLSVHLCPGSERG